MNDAKLKRTFFVLHNHFLFENVKDWILDKNYANLCGMLVHGDNYNLLKKILYMEKCKGQDWIDDSENVPTWIQSDLVTNYTQHNSKLSSYYYKQAIDKILSDDRTFYISERRFFSGRNKFKSPFTFSWYINIAVRNTINILQKVNPEQIIIQTTPHDIASWIFCRTAESMHIPIYIIKQSPLPWRFWIVKGIDQQNIINIEKQNQYNMSQTTKGYVEINQKDYFNALPSYVKKKQSLGVGEKWSWLNELKTNIHKNPKVTVRRIHGMQHKRKLHKEYFNLVKNISLYKKKYIIFFLHYQPERSTLPEGLRYTQQWRAIAELSDNLPEGWELLVKEHPTIFKKPIASWVRPIGFYTSIANMHNVSLVNIESNTFDLIDNSIAVATITGTVGFQAICRSRPVIVFGLAPYRQCPGVFQVNRENPTEQVINQIYKEYPLFDHELFKNYLSWVEVNSFSCDSFSNFDYNDPNIKQKSFEIALMYAFRL